MDGHAKQQLKFSLTKNSIKIIKIKMLKPFHVTGVHSPCSVGYGVILINY